MRDMCLALIEVSTCQRRRARATRWIAHAGLTAVVAFLLIPTVAIVTDPCFGAFCCYPLEHGESKRVRHLALATEMYQVQTHGACPHSLTDLQKQKVVRGTTTRDPWGEAYDIDCYEDGAVVCSAGPDGLFETDDDICSDGEPRW